jgi:hypothetical protein
VKAESHAVTPAPFGGLSTLNLPAAENLQPAFFGTLTRLGISVVVLIFEGINHRHPIFQHAEVEEELGCELQEAKAGRFDSVFHHHDERWIFFHARDLAKSVRTLKATLERYGLLCYAKIAVAESPNELSVWYPPTAKRIVFPE